jgi:3-methylfumaryl-CoA hydratase
MSAIDITYLQTWIGKQETLVDDISLFPAQALAAALDNDNLPQKEDDLPPFWEWLYFLPTPKASATGVDGHPAKGGFLPPVPLPRRMWAAGEASYLQALKIGQAATRVSTIESVELKEGSTGTLVFVAVKHEVFQNDVLCISQIQNIVYREQPAADAPLPPVKAPPAEPLWSKVITPDPVLLFRYSALTFNGHRIHYDRNYAIQEELYSALVVHGPLLVTLLMELKRSELPNERISHIKFRAVRPTFDDKPFKVEGKQDGDKLQFWSVDSDNAMCMKINAKLASAES